MIKYLFEYFLMFAAISIMPGVSFAQPTDSTSMINPELPATIETEYMKNKLALDSATASKVYNINLKIEQKNQEILTSKTMTEVEKYRALEANSQTRDAGMKKVLTKNQYDKYLKMKKDLMDLVKRKK